MVTESMMNRWPIDPAIVILTLGIITILLLIMTIICVVQTNRLYRKYDRFMRGKDAESLEDIIVNEIQEIEELKAQDRINKDMLKTLTRSVKSSFQKFGMVKYNAFKGMGGNLSFAIAILDMNNTGCYLYIKMIERGETDILLGSEEKEALEQALGY